MKLTGFFASLNYSAGGAERAINEALEDTLFRAWDAWVTEFIRIVPVWTGQSVGSILPLAEILGRPVSITPSPTAPGGRSALGASQSSAVIERQPGRRTITYETAIKHLVINEFFDATVFGFNLRRPGPYNFQGQCNAKFLEVVKEARLPDMSRFFDFDTRSF